MRVLLVALCFTIGADAHAATGFEQTYGGQDVDRGVFVSPTEDHGYIAVGTTKSFGEGSEDIYLVRIDSAGKVLWTRTYGGSDEDLGWSVHELPSGFIVAGSTKSFGKGEFDFYLVKTTPDGEIEWSNTFGGEGRDRCWSLAQTNDGGFVLAGETTSFGEGEEDCFLVKTDSLGTLLWSQTYGGKKSDRCFSVVQADEGGYVLAGQTYSEGAGDRDVYVIKTSTRGDLEWSKTFGGEASDVGHCITKANDGDFVVTGYTTSFAPAGDDPYLIKIDWQGKTQWTRVLSLEGINHTLTGDQAADGGFYLVGFSEYPGKASTAALLIKTDSEGRLAWHRNIRSSSTGETFGYTVRSTSDGGCVFVGHMSTSSASDLDLLLVGVEGEDHR